ncbi:MAG: hypothetical protein RLZZ15_2957, partial [Verrucomicrobiota bacterium]
MTRPRLLLLLASALGLAFPGPRAFAAATAAPAAPVVVSAVQHAGAPAWRIRTTDLDWIVDRATAGLVALVDAGGHDWIGPGGHLPGALALPGATTTALEADQPAYARLR